MKPHTTEFKNAIKEMGRELRGVITYGNTTLEDEIMSITPHYEANILKSVMKQLDLELSVDIPLETVINCQIGILVGEEYEMLNFGNYVVYSSEKQEDTNTYKIICYDKLLYSMKQNEDLGVTYPISIKNYLTALATKIGLTVASGTFYNQDLMIPDELYKDLDYTYRDILDEIAQATGSIIALNVNDEIEIRYPNDSSSDTTISGTNITIAEHTGNRIINTTISGNSVQDGTPTPTNPVEVESSGDNGYITEVISNSDNTQSQSYTIPCQQPMKSIGNVRDVFVKENGVWYEKHNLGEVVLDGTESWYMSNDGNFKRFSTLINTLEQFAGRKSNLLSNYFVGNTTGGIGNMYSYDKYVYLYPTSDITSIDSFKAWLSNNNTKVLYVLGTPNYIECTQEQIEAINTILNASLYTGVTNIVSTSYLSVTYNLAAESIDEEYLKDVNVDFAEMYGPVNSIVLSRAGESDNVYIRDEASVQENGLCEVKIVDNQIMNFNNRSDYLQGLLAALDGLSYYKNDFNSTGILYYEVGDMYYVTIGDNAYKCIMLNDEITVTTGIEERIYTDLPEQSETDYTKADKTDRRINQTYIIVDKQNQTISSVVSNVEGQNSKISQINQRLDGLESSVQDIADITTYGESQIAVVNLSDINESEPIMLKVRPIGESIRRLFPNGNLCPSSTQYLKVKKVRFKRTYTEEGVTKTENIDYELPDDLLYYDSNYYDEFYLDYDSQTCQIIKRCEFSQKGENNKFEPRYAREAQKTGITSLSVDYYENIQITPSSTSNTVELTDKIPLDTEFMITLSDLLNIASNNITTYVDYYDSNNTLMGTIYGSTSLYIKDNYNGTPATSFRLRFAFSSRTPDQQYSFKIMLNTGNTAIPFETYNSTEKPKAQEQVIDYPYPAILLGNGDYEISLLGYDIGYLFVRLMAQNIYTRQFATQAQLSSRIEQSAQEIDLSVNQKLTNYSTTNEMNSAINIKANQITSSVSEIYATKQTTNELSTRIKQTAKSIELTANDNGTSAGIVIRVRNEDGTQIDSDSANITLSGLVKFTDLSRSGSTTINGSNITTGTINGNNVNVTNINASNITSGTISGSKISGGTIDGDKVTIKNLDASKITTGTLSASKISGGTLNADNMTVKNLTADSIKSKTLNGISLKSSSISGGSVSGSSISNGSVTGARYKYQADFECIAINRDQDGALEGYYTSDGSLTQSTRRYSIKAFNAGGKFQSFNSSGAMAAYFDQSGAHSSSDIRLKSNISNIEEQTSMEIINNLTPIEFTYKADESKYHRGLSAQEVEQVLKNNGIENEIFEIRENGDYSLNYSELIPDLINCIKYLTKEIEELKGGK